MTSTQFHTFPNSYPDIRHHLKPDTQKAKDKNENITVTETDIELSPIDHTSTPIATKTTSINVHPQLHKSPSPIQDTTQQNVDFTQSFDSLSRSSTDRINTIDDDDLEYPDGGFTAWRVVLGSFFGLFTVFGLINSLGAVQAYIATNQLATKSDSQVSWIFSVFLFLCYLLAGQVGPIFDAYGPYQLTMIGTVFITVGLMTTSLCSQYYQFFLSFSLCTAFGLAMLMTPEIGIVTEHFKKKRGMAIGLSSMGGSVGGVIFPMMLRKLYSTVGFGWALRILGFVCCASAVTSILLIKPRLERTGSNGALFQFSLSRLIDFKSLKDMRFTWLILANFCGELGVMNGLTFFTSYALAQGKSTSLSYALLAVLNSTGIFGRWIPGILADKYFGRFNTLTFTTLMAFVTIFSIWLPFGHRTSGLIVFALLHGFFNGAILSLGPVCCGQICKTREYGTRYGTMFLFASFACLLGVPLSGALIKGTNYNHLVIFNGCLYVGTTVCLVFSRYCAVGFRWCKW